MNHWRTLTILTLMIAPLLLFFAVGAWTLWETGRLFWLWLSLPVGWGLALLLAGSWRKKLIPLQAGEMESPLHWTPRDKQAWEIVKEKMSSADEVAGEVLTELRFYLDAALDLTERITKHYHPKAKDPFGSLTIPEIMVATQLVIEDLSLLYGKYVPGGEICTIDNWRFLVKIPKRYRFLSNLFSAGTALFAPLATATRFAASKTVFTPVRKTIQANVLTWFYSRFLEKVGVYTIEMNSGRLRGGPQKFREAVERLARAEGKPWEDSADVNFENELSSAANTETTTATEKSTTTATAATTTVADAGSESAESPFNEMKSDTDSVTVFLAGQVGAGKSSLVRILQGETPLEPDLLPETTAVTRYRLCPPNSPGMTLLDTPGFSATDAGKKIGKDHRQVLQQADMILLLMDATSAARDADLKFLDGLWEWSQEHPQLKPPPVIAVLTKIDLLRPSMEWSPPYNWESPSNPKAMSIHEAVSYNRELLGHRVTTVVPVCTDFARAYGISEWLLPAIRNVWGDARAGGVVRDLHDELDRGKATRALEQVWNIGKALRGSPGKPQT